MKKEFVDVGFQQREPRWDFGLINDARGHIKVEKKAWLEYVRKRLEFEVLHYALVEQIPKRLKGVDLKNEF